MTKWLAGAAILLVAALGMYGLNASARSRSATPPAAGAVADRPTPAPAPAPTPTVRTRNGLPVFSHVFVIVMENREYSSIIGNPSAPYLNSLAARYGLATNYFAVTRPSLPNYLALTAGSTLGITSNCTDCVVHAEHLANQVEADGRTWKAYTEDMPTPCYLGASSGGYVQRHNPFVYYGDIRGDPARCAAHVVPFSQFAGDLADGALPDLVWITPNLCHTMHDCSTAAGDEWLASLVPGILESPAWLEGGLLFITFDEGSTASGCCGNASGGRVATLIIGPGVIPGIRSETAQTHYSLLRTIEESWGLAPLGEARTAAVMREYFRP